MGAVGQLLLLVGGPALGVPLPRAPDVGLPRELGLGLRVSLLPPGGGAGESLLLLSFDLRLCFVCCEPQVSKFFSPLVIVSLFIVDLLLPLASASWRSLTGSSCLNGPLASVVPVMVPVGDLQETRSILSKWQRLLKMKKSNCYSDNNDREVGDVLSVNYEAEVNRQFVGLVIGKEKKRSYRRSR